MFTNTIRLTVTQLVNHDLSKEIIIQNYQNIIFSYVANYTCNGDLIGFQPKTYSYNIQGYKYVKKITLKLINSISDDISVLRVNNSISIQGPLLADYEWPSTTEKTFDFRMNSPELKIEVGTYNTQPNHCSFSGGFSVELHFY